MTAIKKDEFAKQPNIVKTMERAKKQGSRLHLMGLISDGGVHSYIDHLYALLRCAKDHKVEHVFIHFFGDGRDTAPRSASKYIQQLLDYIKKVGVGEISTVVGRYYAMDRDKRWDRVKIAVDALVQGKGDKCKEDELVKTVEDGYTKDITDEFIKPIICGSDDSRLKGELSRGLLLNTDGDTVFTFNYRSDRMRELVTVLGLPDKPMEVEVPKDLNITTMTKYNPEFTFEVAFPPHSMANVLAETLSKQGVKQCHIAGEN